MHPKVVFFDYGGTLDGEASHWLDRFVELYREQGVDTPFDEIKTAFYAADQACYARKDLAEYPLGELMRFHVGVQLDRLAIGDGGLHLRLVDCFVSRSEAALAASRTVLERLAGSFRLGVISNFYGNVARILADAGIAPLLSAVVDSTAVGLWKPDERIFRHALDAVGAKPCEALHVGDSYERDVRAAHAAGLLTAWLCGDTDCDPPGDPRAVDVRLDRLVDLIAVLGASESPKG